MTEEQKRFMIVKKESYEKQISQEKKNATTKTFLLGLASAGMLAGFLAAARNSSISERAFSMTLGLITAGYSAYSLKGVMEAISKKTMLEGKILDIDTELEMSENLENKGMKR